MSTDTDASTDTDVSTDALPGLLSAPMTDTAADTAHDAPGGAAAGVADGAELDAAPERPTSGRGPAPDGERAPAATAVDDALDRRLDAPTVQTDFARRHIGPDDAQRVRMLSVLGLGSVDALLDATVPAGIRDEVLPALPEPAGEQQALAELAELAAANRVTTPMIGLGYSDTVTPPVILRNVLENPAWYTAYTPYQPEIAQGRLEALLTFQTVVTDLTGLPIANASLLDESTAAAEAMTLLRRSTRSRQTASRFAVDADVLPQTRAVLATRAEPLGIELVDVDLDATDPAGLARLLAADGGTFGVLFQYPGASGRVRELGPFARAAADAGAGVAVAADLLGLTLLTPPGEWGADVVVGTSQRFGVPLGCGGPHAGYIAVRTGLERMLPGRLVGTSVDADGNPAHRLALQTREQHIRRDRATSNICTAQVLLAVMAAMYAVWHGPDGLRRIAARVHRTAAVLAAGLREPGFAAAGVRVEHEEFFDTVAVRVPGRARGVWDALRADGITARLVDDDRLGFAVDERTPVDAVRRVWSAVAGAVGGAVGGPAGSSVTPELAEVDARTSAALPASLRRTTAYLTHPRFARYRSETSMLRYLRRLADRDYALDRGMIPLGSCTMKLNGTAEMEPVTWPGFAGIHPFAPAQDMAGYSRVVADLSGWLARITGYAAVSLQPNAGSQGEYAGLLAIRAYHRSRGDDQRTVCLVPASAHGTNAASAVMAGLRVVVVPCADNGDVDLVALRVLVDKHRDSLAAIMVTYPSTHGVYEAGIAELAGIVHDAGGQVYIDGANLNALCGVAGPGHFGGDVSHLNLHKTFCIPHGGGGPGVGPVAVAEHLIPFLPSHPMHPDADLRAGAVGPVSGAPFGSASILPISWAYVRMMGGAGLRSATGNALLSANYVAERLRQHYPVLYAGADGHVAHECILDIRPLTQATGVTVDDVAKRLVDYGFHAPTMSFPVAGTLMVEPTESEDLAELDRFVDAMVAIRVEADRVGSGEWPNDDNPLVNAPHTAAMVTSGTWSHPYPRELAAHPAGPETGVDKYWPPVRRVDGAYGDRNLVCSCPPVSELADPVG